MKKKSLNCAAALGAAAMLSAGSVGAMTLDFIKHIDLVSGEKAMEGTPFSSEHVPIATTARGYSGSADDGKTGDSPYAYFDFNKAGIGVCKLLVADDQCSPSNDDNVTEGEILGLSWGTSVLLNSLSFRGEAHPNDPKFDGTDLFDYSTDGGFTWSNKVLLNANPAVGAFQGVVDFGGLLLGANQEIWLAFKNEQFYVSAANITAVPIPAAAWLLGSGLVGLFGVGRRRRAGSSAA